MAEVYIVKIREEDMLPSQVLATKGVSEDIFTFTLGGEEEESD